MFSTNVVINDGDFTRTIYTMIKEGRYQDAIKVLHGIPESSSNRAGLSLLAYCYFYVQDFANAASYYEQLTVMLPDNADYKLYHAQALYQSCLYDEAFNVTKEITNEEYNNQAPQKKFTRLRHLIHCT